MRTTNPALNLDTISRVGATVGHGAMTVQGAVNKTGLCLVILLLAGSWVWGRSLATAAVPGLAIAGAIGGFVVAIVTIFKTTWAPVTAPLYAALEGLVLGGISAYFEMTYTGIVVQAVLLTFGTLAALLMAYTSGLIKVTAGLRRMVIAATGGVCLVYLATWILGFFGFHIPFIHDSGPVGIGVSLLVVGIAALNLVLDFDFIEQGASAGLPSYMEWYAAFGLMVTLIWLYLEVLRLLAKMRSRR